MSPKPPEEIEEHSKDYYIGSWADYSLQELGDWVHLLHKRATHRTNLEKKEKDLRDARNYWIMMGAWLDEAETRGVPYNVKDLKEFMKGVPSQEDLQIDFKNMPSRAEQNNYGF